MHPVVGLLLRLTVGVVFLYACVYKIRDPRVFADGVLDFHMLPSALVVPFSLILPWIEAIAGICLVAGVLRRGAAALALLMLVAFMVAIAFAILRGIDISCGCFHATTEGTRVAWMTLGRDLLIVVATIPLLIMPRTTLEIAPGRKRAGNAPATVAPGVRRS